MPSWPRPPWPRPASSSSCWRRRRRQRSRSLGSLIASIAAVGAATAWAVRPRLPGDPPRGAGRAADRPAHDRPRCRTLDELERVLVTGTAPAVAYALDVLAAADPAGLPGPARGADRPSGRRRSASTCWPASSSSTWSTSCPPSGPGSPTEGSPEVRGASARVIAVLDRQRGPRRRAALPDRPRPGPAARGHGRTAALGRHRGDPGRRRAAARARALGRSPAAARGRAGARRRGPQRPVPTAPARCSPTRTAPSSRPRCGLLRRSATPGCGRLVIDQLGRPDGPPCGPTGPGAGRRRIARVHRRGPSRRDRGPIRTSRWRCCRPPGGWDPRPRSVLLDALPASLAHPDRRLGDAAAAGLLRHRHRCPERLATSVEADIDRGLDGFAHLLLDEEAVVGARPGVTIDRRPDRAPAGATTSDRGRPPRPLGAAAATRRRRAGRDRAGRPRRAPGPGRGAVLRDRDPRDGAVPGPGPAHRRCAVRRTGRSRCAPRSLRGPPSTSPIARSTTSS